MKRKLGEANEETDGLMAEIARTKPEEDRNEHLGSETVVVLRALADDKAELTIRIGKQTFWYHIDVLRRIDFVADGVEGYYVLPKGRAWLYERDVL